MARGWWKEAWAKQAENWIYEPLEPGQVPGSPQRVDVRKDEEYLNIFLRYMRVPFVRKGLTKFYGVVHCYSSVPTKTGKNASFHCLTTPTQLTNVDAKDLDRVVTGTERLLGPVPYRGSDVEIELGLFSIAFAELAGPYIDTLEQLAKLAGVGYVNQAMPFVDPILNGIKLLCGAQNGSPLEIGLKETLNPPKTGYYIVMRAPEGSVDIQQCKLRRSHELLDSNGDPIKKYPYLIFSVEATDDRGGFTGVPDVADAYKKFTDAVKTHNVDVTKNEFEAFKTTTLTSPDLTRDEANKLVKGIKEEFDWAFAPTGERARTTPQIPPLSKIKIEG